MAVIGVNVLAFFSIYYKTDLTASQGIFSSRKKSSLTTLFNERLKPLAHPKELSHEAVACN